MAPQGNTGTGAEAELPEYAGHYRLDSCLGSGGMGVVHVARSTSGMKLAVKVVHTEFAKDPEFRGRFRQEVAAARKVSGAFTASVVDADPDAERPWMATLFIPGPTLSDHVKRNGPMPPAELRRLMAGLAEALRDIHRVGVVHRDLKPSNVLLADDGPKVIDFGISRPKDSELRTETGKLIGTPPFMAPEQFRRPREVGPAADIFALGSVMVHAATGRGPFDSDSPYVVAYQVVHDEPDLTGVPANLAPLITRCLAKEPEDRPTPDELMRELRSVAASYDTQAFIPAQRTVDVPVPERKAEGPVRRHERVLRRGVLLAAGALVLVAGGVLASIQLLGDGQPAPKDTTPRAGASASRAWEAKPVAEGTGTPQCSYGSGKLLCVRAGLVYAVDPADGSLLWRHKAGTTRWSVPPALSGGVVLPLPDFGNRLEALDPDTGRTRWQRNVPTYDGTWSAGGMLLVTRADGTVTGVDSASGDTKWSRKVPGHATPAFSTFAGDPLLYVTSTSVDESTTRVTAVDAATGDVRWDERLDGALTPVGSESGSLFFLSVDQVFDYARAVVRFTPASGATRKVSLPVPRQGAEAAVHDGVVYVLAAGGAMEAVDVDTGRRLWHLETSVSRGSVPVPDGRHVFVAASDGRLLAVDARKGTLAGQTPARLGPDAGDVVATLPRPILAGRHVYATAPDGTVFAVAARTPSDW
ncbi:serine/threonine protein kinase/outer membrane protein assembly factor BamB [Streptomyces sp. SAI-135]|uniref:serine/threonine-protein kinase n=1 Tax=unclassified Streptomyces TaxID=2593676 RepID=UPI002473F004|nr:MULTISPECIES: serine/threonine-protein kinase [unclassified Streptomyces]MDH6517370.1 serine/threonine protein kinase/outer membrane protein assembly factor BamB [Streptomyces sp. SAI-090]MDH6618541.1 serine/threonine protein kinase/outer membrane protein assembly factor BamB [Streptomyces sp. SAI-135]